MMAQLAAAGWVRQNWRRVVLAGVAMFVVITVGRSLLPGATAGSGSNDPSGEPSATESPPATVKLDGVLVPEGGAPMITLNPGLVRLGGTVSVYGAGFDAGSKVDIKLTPAKAQKNATGAPVATATAGKDGSISASFVFPAQTAGEATRKVTAQQRGSAKVASAEAAVAQGVGQATLSAIVGKPGDTVSLTVRGFNPGEDLLVYWGRIVGEPTLTLKADSSGSLSKVPLRVGVAAVGVASLVVVGKTSGIAASAPFQILSLYPSIKLAPYAVKASQRISFSGKGFAPGERVLVRLNSASGQPIMVVQTDQGGGFTGAGLVLPYELKGKQSLIFVGEQSRATTSSGFTILPYQPIVRASAYGGLPGTGLTFYADGFAPNEAVHVSVGDTKGSKGELIAAFRVNERGKASGVGMYVVPGNAGNSLTFTLTGMRSGASASVNFKVDHSGGPVEVPPQQKYVLPKELEK
jgi:hypothetical protein